MNNDICVIITSVVFFKNKELSYSDTRSLFSPEERLEQVKNTIQSVRDTIPQAKIFFLEQGLVDVKDEISRLVDNYYYVGNRKIARWATDSRFKGFGEAVGLLLLNKSLPNDSKLFFKLSGRYYLNDNFDINKWNCKKINILKKGDSFSTRLYSFPQNYRKYWKASLLLSLPLLLLNLSIERTMLLFIPKNKITEIEALGVSGLIGVDGLTINE